MTYSVAPMGASLNAPRYRSLAKTRMNHPSFLKIQSSIATLMQLRDETDNQSQYVAYTHAITKLREQLGAINHAN